MSSRTKIGIAVGTGVVALAAGAFFLLSGKSPSDLPIVGGLVDEPAVCPLTGEEPAKESAVERPAIAVKVENATIAYPLSGLENAEVVYEELVEGGMTRFMAIYHCSDSTKVGPVRSARVVDAAIVTPLTRVLAFSGQNAHVLEALKAADIVRLDETTANGALERIPREGLSSEHTLYADTKALRKLALKSFDEPPPEDVFAFGELEGKSRKASSITINFNPSNAISYEWSGSGWLRSEGGQPFVTESGEQIEVSNVLIEEHDVNLSDTIVDPVGNPSTEIGDVTGSGRAVLFRDGRAIVGRWERETELGPVKFVTKAGEEMVFAQGSIWVELVPSDRGEVKGSFDFAK